MQHLTKGMTGSSRGDSPLLSGALFFACLVGLALMTGCGSGAPEGSLLGSSGEAHGGDAQTGNDGAITREEYLAELGRIYGIEDPPSVEVVEEIDRDEGLAPRGRCLEERGWSVTYEPGGISMESPPEEQQEAFNRDQYYCDAAYPFAQSDQSPEERQIVWYEYLTETYVPCVEELGFEVSPAPSLETFLAQGIESWVPNYEVGAQARQMGKPFAEVDEKCPQEVPLEVLEP